MEEQLRKSYSECLNRFPGVLIRFEDYAERVGRLRVADAQALDKLPLADIYLAAALEQENQRALELFYREHCALIAQVSRKYALNLEDAEDVAQEICAAIAVRIKNYQGRGSLRGWLCAITPNLTRDRYRTGAERFESSLEGRTEADGAEQPSEHPGLLSDEGRAAERLRGAIDKSRCEELFEKTLGAALDGLKPAERELIFYKFIKGLKSREIALIRGVNEDVISKHLKKTLALLQKRILTEAKSLFNFSSREIQDCFSLSA